ncbi:uncharacterized protein LOC142365378 [Opisthocomus hoazin]|uniref:uncharacterized protein LOC142365378 n=1 Tax=Opisthocomus hoazin TaxID=30419 RepID=UPI003F52C03D
MEFFCGKLRLGSRDRSHLRGRQPWGLIRSTWCPLSLTQRCRGNPEGWEPLGSCRNKPQKLPEPLCLEEESRAAGGVTTRPCPNNPPRINLSQPPLPPFGLGSAGLDLCSWLLTNPAAAGWLGSQTARPPSPASGGFSADPKRRRRPAAGCLTPLHTLERRHSPGSGSGEGFAVPLHSTCFAGPFPTRRAAVSPCAGSPRDGCYNGNKALGLFEAAFHLFHGDWCRPWPPPAFERWEGAEEGAQLALVLLSGFPAPQGEISPWLGSGVGRVICLGSTGWFPIAGKAAPAGEVAVGLPETPAGDRLPPRFRLPMFRRGRCGRAGGRCLVLRTGAEICWRREERRSFHPPGSRSSPLQIRFAPQNHPPAIHVVSETPVFSTKIGLCSGAGGAAAP